MLGGKIQIRKGVQGIFVSSQAPETLSGLQERTGRICKDGLPEFR
jgi:hypothetical protein